MGINLVCANNEDYESIRNFYYTLTEQMQNTKYKPGWIKDVYPTQTFLLSSIERKELFYVKDKSSIQACMIVNHTYNDGYNHVDWSIQVNDDQLMVIHALGVLPEYAGKGIAQQMVKQVIIHAKKENIKTIRLDVLEGNLPAEKVYTKVGFRYVDTIRMFYEDTGWTNYRLYEYLL